MTVEERKARRRQKTMSVICETGKSSNVGSVSTIGHIPRNALKPSSDVRRGTREGSSE